MPQFIIPKQDISGDKFTITDPAEASHLARVLRARTGEKINLFDGVDKRYLAEIREISKGSVAGVILKEIPFKKRNFSLRVFASLIKFDRFELLLEKLTEVGVDEIVPVITARTAVKIHAAGIASKAQRWEKIIIAAVKQCNCQKIPELGGLTSFRDALKLIKPEDLNLIAYESESPENSIKKLLTANRLPLTAVNLFIGPEGGFTDEEIKEARTLGLSVFSLGSNTLRAETAAVAAASIILYELSE